jgi:BirA family biotin operon repressor/biotin-[acetyl-CoA-carboxylase] ligase
MRLGHWPLPHTRCLHFESLDSTNQEALRRIGDGSGAPCWLVADVQSAGRGRQGRHWHSQAGNLFASLHVRLACAAQLLPQLSLVAGVAALTAIDQACTAAGVASRPCLKWPNDILLGGGKLGGVLVESRSVAGSGGNIFDVVIGIGINIVGSPSDEQLFPATSLAAHDVPIGRDDLLVALAVATDHWLRRWNGGAGFGGIREEWLAHACHLGRNVEMVSGDERRRGRFATIDAGGALVLVDETGAQHRISSGHLQLVDAEVDTGTTK